MKSRKALKPRTGIVVKGGFGKSLRGTFKKSRVTLDVGSASK